MKKVNSVATGRIKIAQCIKDSCLILKDNPVLLIVTSLIAAVISSASFTWLLGPMMMGMFMICDGLISGKKPKPEIGDLFKGFSFLIPGILLDILGHCGAILCGVGVLVTLPVAIWAMMRVVDTRMSVGDALKDSIDYIFKQENYSVIFVILVAYVLAIVGIILCCVGVIATVPLLYVIPTCAYRQVYKTGK